MASTLEKEPWYLNICEEMEEFCTKIDEKINEKRQIKKANEKRNEIECKLAQEIKRNMELKEQLSKLNRRGDEMEKACNNFSKLTITDNDQQRLDNTRELYQVAKELTGIRFDYSAPPDKVKGYIKNESLRILRPFELDAEDKEGLWQVMQAASHPDWPGKENRSPN